MIKVTPAQEAIFRSRKKIGKLLYRKDKTRTMNPRELWNRLERKEESNQTFSKIFFGALIIFILFLGIGRISFLEFGIPLSFGKNVKNMLFGLLFFFLLKRVVKKDYSIPKTPINLWIWPFALWVVISTYPDIWEAMKKIFPICCLYFAIDSLNSKEKIQQLTLAILVSGCAAVLITLFKSLALGQAFANISLRGSPNTLAAFLTPIIVLGTSLSLNCSEDKKGRLIYLVFILIMGAGLLFTDSRGAWAGFLAAITVLGLMKKRYLFLFVFLLSVVLFAFSILWLAPTSRLAKDIGTFGNLKTTPKVQRLLYQWKICLKIIKDHPLRGIGPGKFREIYPTYKSKIGRRVLPHPHNSYLDIAVSLGIPAFFLFSIISFIFLKTSIVMFLTIQDQYHKSVLSGVLAGVAGFMTHGLVDSLFITVDEAIPCLFWLFIGLVFAIKYRHGS